MLSEDAISKFIMVLNSFKHMYQLATV